MSLSIKQPQLGLYNFSLIGPNLVFKMTSTGKVWCADTETGKKTKTERRGEMKGEGRESPGDNM